MSFIFKVNLHLSHHAPGMFLRTVRFAMAALLISLSMGGMPSAARAQPPSAPIFDTRRADQELAAYFQEQVSQINRNCLSEILTVEDWTARQSEYRRQLYEMLSLDPLPEKSDLRPVVTGKIDHPDFVVERLHFQSMPGLYVTGNLFIPKGLTAPAPTILYVCGHSPEKKDNVSFGNKTHYQHHAAWFARNGYVCLTIDTLQMGEIEALHHGTYREGMWWWNSRGYTPGGVEAWNAIRALDYLESRPEVDRTRFGVTGRSGGGATSWWLAALDTRVQVAVPVAGITDLQDHVVDGCVEGHCDCMYIVNTYRWDYGQLAALLAPRPVLLTNSDKDPIFPLDGVIRVHGQMKRIYDLLGASDRLGLQISEGPHKDIQELQVAAFRWFNRYLKNEPLSLAEKTGEKPFPVETLRVFESLPADQVNTQIQESFTKTAPEPAPPVTREDWQRQRDQYSAELTQRCFRGWPAAGESLQLRTSEIGTTGTLKVSAIDFLSQSHCPLRMYVVQSATAKPTGEYVLQLIDQQEWERKIPALSVAIPGALKEEIKTLADGGPNQPATVSAEVLKELTAAVQTGQGLVLCPPRGVGLSAYDRSPKKQIHNRRRYMLIGQTIAGMQAYDVTKMLEAFGSSSLGKGSQVTLRAKGDMAVPALYGSLFGPPIHRLELAGLAGSHRHTVDILNVLRVLDVPQAVAIAADRHAVSVKTNAPEAFGYPRAVGKLLDWGDRLKIDAEEDSAPTSGGSK